MVDPRVRKLAEILVDYSTKVKKGDRVLIDADVDAHPLILEVYKLCLQRGAYPRVKIRYPGLAYIFFKYASAEQVRYFPEVEYYEIKHTDVYIRIRAPRNLRELESVDPTKISERMKVLKPILDWRVDKTRWVVVDYPTPALAQEAGMSMEEYEDFLFKACLIDWKELSKKLHKLKEILDKTDKVKIIGEDTELEFSIKGRVAIVADGEKNMPDGEVFTSVLEDSVNGYIYFDLPAVYLGRVVEGVRLEFKDGVVVKASARVNEELLKRILETDEGARRIGEFGIGLNYNITRPTKNILFDEKIGGTIHLALGRGYKETLSKNESAIHWDLIKDMRKKGSRIYFDGKLVFEDGKWLILE